MLVDESVWSNALGDEVIIFCCGYLLVEWMVVMMIGGKKLSSNFLLF